MDDDKQAPEAEDKELKKPSLISQLIPYLATAVILAWVFTGLSSNVVDERHELSGGQWSELLSLGVRPASLDVRSIDGTVVYCSAEEAAEDAACPAGGDYEVRAEAEEAPMAIRRTASTRISDGHPVSLNYVKKVSLSEIWALVKKADLRLFIPVMVLLVLVFFLADVFSFGLAYRMFNVPDIKTLELMECRGAPYVIQVGLAVLAEALFPLYMRRVKGAPVTETLSSNLWTIILDVTAILTVITPAVAYNLYAGVIPAIGPGWLAGCGIFWLVFTANLVFWHSPLRDRAAAWIATGREGVHEKTRGQKMVGEAMQLLRTFSMARWHQYLRVYLTRLIMWLVMLASNYVALRAMEVDPSLPLAMIGIPLIVMGIFLPVSVGGYGGPQLIAWFLLVKVGGAGTADQVIAYSLLWSTCFLIGRAAIGLVFIRGFWKRCFPEGFKF